jgi:SPARC-related modular calcium-binding protein
MPRFCDVNNDKKITLSEWLNCMRADIREQNERKPVQAEPKSPTQIKLKGVNPLEFILKAD